MRLSTSANSSYYFDTYTQEQYTPLRYLGLKNAKQHVDIYWTDAQVIEKTRPK